MRIQVVTDIEHFRVNSDPTIIFAVVLLDVIET